MSSPVWKHAASSPTEKGTNPRTSIIALRPSPSHQASSTHTTSSSSSSPSSSRPISSAPSPVRTTWNASSPSTTNAPSRPLSTRTAFRATNAAGGSNMRQLICIQGIVRAWLVARTLKKRVHTHLFRTKVAFEILTSEQGYMKDLLVTVNEFFVPMSAQYPPEQLATVFSNIKEIISVHTTFIGLTESKLKQWGYAACIAKEVLPVLDSFSCYEKYINNFSHAMEFLKEHQQNQSPLHKLFESKATSKACRGLGIHAFLITPVQRLPRLILLMKEMLRYTPEEHPDYAYTKEALAKMQGIAEKLNESRRKAENKEKVQTITKSVSGLTLELSTREFMKEGPLEEVITNKTSVRTALTSSGGINRSIKELVGYYVFMFNDCLLCAKRLSAPARVVMNLGRKGITYQFSTPIVIPLPSTAKASADVTIDYAFIIEFPDPDSEDEMKKEHRMFVTTTAKNRDEWIQQINSKR